MESVITENRKAVAHVQTAEWEEALRRVEAYLSAWRIGDAQWTRDCAREILGAARRSTVSQGNELKAGLDEAEKFIKSYLDKPESAEALAFGVPLEGRLDFGDRAKLSEVMDDGILNLGRSKTPVRPPETRAMKMQTSLSRLPSIRLIGGWIGLIALLFLLFVLTHR